MSRPFESAIPPSLRPTAIPGQVAGVLLNHLLRGQPVRERLDTIDGRTLSLQATDLPLRLAFRVDGRRLVAATARDADVLVRASLRDFIALARREEDPDTLFFQRRLSVEGATETGLALKNLLDAFEYDVEAHCRDVLPAPLATVVTTALRAYRASRAGSRRNTRPATRPPA